MSKSPADTKFMLTGQPYIKAVVWSVMRFPTQCFCLKDRPMCVPLLCSVDGNPHDPHHVVSPVICEDAMHKGMMLRAQPRLLRLTYTEQRLERVLRQSQSHGHP